RPEAPFGSRRRDPERNRRSPSRRQAASTRASLSLSVKLYLDHNVSRAIALGARLRGVDVLTAFEDEAHRLPDPKLLDRAAELERVAKGGEPRDLADPLLFLPFR